MTPWVLRLIVANAAMFLVQMAGPQSLWEAMVFVPMQLPFRPWSIITYMFLHGGLGHIFFNMLSLFFFGPRLEARLGGRRFLILYFVSGMVGALLSFAFAPRVGVIGASGAVFGVMLGYAAFWPRDQILIWGILPVEARVMVIAMTALALFGGFSGGGGIAHFAHLGGFLGGWLSLKWFERHSDGRKWQAKVAPPRPREPSDISMARWRKIKREGLHEVNRTELDRILDKINSQGIHSLTQSDREFLERFSGREGLH